MKNRENLAGLSIITGIALTLGKILAGLFMNSASVMAGGIHSGLDLAAAFLSYFSVSQTGKPADEDHHYGHGKYENVAAMGETFFVILAVIFIIYISLAGPGQRGIDFDFADIGIAVTAISALVTFLVWLMMSGEYKKTGSPALQSNARHMITNSVTSLVICLGIAAMRYTALEAIDSVLAVAVALVLICEGYGHLKKSAGGIVDIKMPEKDEELIKEILARYGGNYVQYHALRTRQSGPDSHVDLHLVVPRDQMISVTHELCDSIENEIREKLPGVNILIHAEPCRPMSGECSNCGISKTGGGAERAEGCTAKKGKDASTE
ncbi:MAG: cation diffusion facilitator family transporter [Bacillota bacterium]